MRKKNENGFTLVELVVVVAIIGLLVTMGVPGFMKLLPGWRLKSAATDLFGNMQMAKVSAISKGTTCRVTFSAGQYVIDFPNLPGAPVLKTVFLSDYGSGIQFLGPDNIATYTSAQVNFNKRGLSDQVSDAIVYLTSSNKEKHYRVVLTPAAIIKLQKRTGNSWE